MEATSLTCCANCRQWNVKDLVALATEEIKPAWWNSDHRICYRLLLQMFEVCGRFEGNQGERVRKMLCVLDQSLTIIMQNLDMSNL